METKECIKCHKIKELSEFPIRKCGNNKNSYRNECIGCLKLRQKEYHESHKEEIKKWHKLYYKNNKEQLKIKNDKWWDENREKMNNHRKEKRKKELTPENKKIIPINNEDIYKNWL